MDQQRLSIAQQAAIAQERTNLGTIGVSVISCWEVAKLTSVERLTLPMSVTDWLDRAKRFPRLQLLPLSLDILLASTQLPDGFRSDPADEILIATSRHHNCILVTSDQKIRNYDYVETV